MLCDPLTKHGGEGFADRLVTAYNTGFMDLEATTESEMRKMKARKSRQAAQEGKKVNHTNPLITDTRLFL